MTDRQRGRGRVTQCGGKGLHRRMVEGNVKCLSTESLESFGIAWVVCLAEIRARSQSWHLYIEISKITRIGRVFKAEDIQDIWTLEWERA